MLLSESWACACWASHSCILAVVSRVGITPWRYECWYAGEYGLPPDCAGPVGLAWAGAAGLAWAGPDSVGVRTAAVRPATAARHSRVRRSGARRRLMRKSLLLRRPGRAARYR